MEKLFEPNLKNILEQKTLKWLFVGGKGGVGKTTISTSLAILFSHYRESVLIISTDPAHNLSDAFNQKMGKEPTLIKNYTNLYGLELDPSNESENISKINQIFNINPNNNNENQSQFNFESNPLLKNMKSSFPGIDEAINLKYLGALINDSKYDLVIFDTAPTGHTLRFLEMPSIIGKSLEKMLQLKAQYGTMIQSVASMFNNQFENLFDKFFLTMYDLKKSLELTAQMFKDPNKTSFIAVCIPEFLSVYETERLIEALYKDDIDIRNIVVNQVLINENNCKMCKTRMKMQGKYLEQIYEMFEDFHIVKIPLQKNEIRGTENLENFGKFLLNSN
jgi:arsenite-transporting ATPase